MVVTDVPLRRRDRARRKKGQIVFKRISGRLFVGGVNPVDARQGLIGDCYLLCSLSAVAHANPKILETMVRGTSTGRYRVTFRKRLGGGKFRPQSVVVDGRIPMLNRSSSPVYARTSPSPRDEYEIWPMIAEKAYAAWKGGYDVIGEGGMVEETLEEITGEPTRMFYIAEHDPDLLWSLLLRSRDEHWPVTVCTWNRAARPGLDELGLHPYHIHIFLGAHAVRGKRFITLRDPFDKPTCGKLVFPDANGVFTLQWEDFLTYFFEIHINGRAVADVPSAPYPSVRLSDTLDSSYIFRSLSRSDLVKLAKDFTKVVAAAGKHIVTCGEDGDAFYLIRSGSASVELPDPAGKRKHRVAILNAGEQFGEMSLIDHAPRRSDIVALNETVLYRLSARKFQKWIHLRPFLVDRIRRRFDLQVWLQKSKYPMTTVSLDELLSAGNEEKFRTGEFAFRSGEPADCFYLVLDGGIELLAKTPTGREKLVKKHGAGELFGEEAATAQRTRIATARASSRTRVMRIDLRRVAELTGHYDVVQRQLQFVAERRMKKIEERCSS